MGDGRSAVVRGEELGITRRGLVGGLAGAVAAPAMLLRASGQVGSLRVGLVLSATGVAVETGQYQLNGAKLALSAVNRAGGVLGKRMEFVTEDDMTTNPGAVLAFSRLSSQADIVAFLGSSRSTQNHAMAPDILKVGKPMMFGGTDPVLTRMGNPWMFRFRPNDTYSARVIADFGTGTLRKKKWAVIHSTDAYGTSGAKFLTDELQKAGSTIVLDQGYPNQNPDFTPVVLAIKQSGADVIGSYMLDTDLGIFARQPRQLGVATPWVGSATITSATALRLAGHALYGTYGVADYVEDSSEEAKAFGTAYRAAYRSPPDFVASWPYDAVTVLALAINKAGTTEPKAIREAILSVRGHPGANGEYNFDQNGDGLHGYNIVENKKGNISFLGRVEFTD